MTGFNLFRCRLALALTVAFGALCPLPAQAARQASIDVGASEASHWAMPPFGINGTRFFVTGTVEFETGDTCPNPLANPPIMMARDNVEITPTGSSSGTTGNPLIKTWAAAYNEVHNGNTYDVKGLISIKAANGDTFVAHSGEDTQACPH